MPSPPPETTTALSLRRRYVGGLLAVALLAAAGHVVIQSSLAGLESAGHVVNLSGRQRMLSERAVKESLRAAVAADARARRSAAARLRATVELWARVQRGLAVGDAALGLDGRNSPAVAARLAALAPDARAMHQAARRVLRRIESPPPAAAAGAAAGAAAAAALARDVESLIRAQRAYFGGMDRVVFAYDQEVHHRVVRLQATAAALMGGMVAALLLVGWFVLRPAVARMGSAVDALASANGALVESNASLARANGELREAQRLAGAAERTKSAILSNMSHEIRTPLTGILGYADLLREEADGQFDDLISPIERGAQRLLHTLDAVLDLARLDRPLATDRVDVSDAVEGLVGLFRTAASRRGLALTARCVPGAVAQSDPRAVQRALASIVDNAVRFTERGGVALAVSVEGAAGAEEGAVVVRVTDTGPGIQAHLRQRLFEAFEQGSTGEARSHEGAGLGLTVAHRLVAAMGGTLALESAPGAGTTVTVRLPAARAALPSPGAAARAAVAA